MLTAGTRIGPYEIESPLGAGGMGEVYKARDNRLDRLVAVKILPAALAADAVFRERFEREARTISQITHPHICTLFDVGDALNPDVAPDAASTADRPATIRYLVMEYLEGETLAARLEHGPMKLDEALRTACQVSSALDAAHRAGIVHRDLKPGNIMITRSGAKLLDFGLAKQTASAIAGPGGALIAAAASAAVTAQGTIVGTFQYMAPEQLEGAEADARADIFAFGTILYEMVTGQKAFEGKTPVSLITSILRDEPKPIASLSPVAPRALDRIIRACMAKDPDARLRSTHDLFLQLQWLSEGDAHAEVQTRSDATPAVAHASSTILPVAAKRGPDSLAWTLTAALAAVLVGGAIYSFRGRPVAAPAEPIQFIMPPPENALFSGGVQVPALAVSPDGRQIAFVATTPGPPMLFLRALNSVATKAVPGTEGAQYPFWSPDSRSIAFFASGKLKRLTLGGGSPIAVCDAPVGRGGTWNADNVIVFAASSNGPLSRVPASGGTPSAATAIESSRGETTHRWPQFLPDGKHFLYHAVGNVQRPSEVRVGTLDSTDSATLLAAESAAQYASGHLFFWRDGAMMAQPFDAGTRQLKGDPIRVAEPVGQNVGYASFSASTGGVLVYARSVARPTSQLTWIDRSGKRLSTVGKAGEFFNISLALDEQHVAATLSTGSPENRDVWLFDLQRSIESRLTSDPAPDVLPLWSPDGSRVLFQSTRPGATGPYTKASTGAGQEELLAKFDEGNAGLDWSHDNKYLLYFSSTPKTGFDLWVLPLAGDRKPIAFMQSAFNEEDGAFSPDVHWVAYTSDESGRTEVYVQPFPTNGAKYRVSRDGGVQPAWRGDGRELFFLAPDGTMMAAAIGRNVSGLEVGAPQALFASGVVGIANRHQYAATQNGQRFLVNLLQPGSTPTPLTVVVNWQSATIK